MAEAVQIIAANEDTLSFESAFIADDRGQPVPRAIVGGVICNIQTEPGPLARGLAFCEPVAPDLAEHWPLYVDVDLGAGEERLWNFSVNARIVDAARRFAQLLSEGRATAGTPL